MVNKAILIGRLGKDPEIRRFDNNSAVCNFTMATSESYVDKEGNRQEQTEWHNIAIWRKGLVDVAERFLKKGHLLYVEGRIRTRSWEDADNNKHYITEIIVESFKMLEKKNNNTATDGDFQNNDVQDTNTPEKSVADTETDISDDLPF